MKHDITSLWFELKAEILDGKIIYEITCDSYFDDTVTITDKLILTDQEVELDYDGWGIKVLLDLTIRDTEEGLHVVEVSIQDDTILLEELNDVMEEDIEG